MSIMLGSPPYKNGIFGSADVLRNACVEFAKSGGYVEATRNLVHTLPHSQFG